MISWVHGIYYYITRYGHVHFSGKLLNFDQVDRLMMLYGFGVVECRCTWATIWHCLMCAKLCWTDVLCMLEVLHIIFSFRLCASTLHKHWHVSFLWYLFDIIITTNNADDRLKYSRCITSKILVREIV